MNELSPWGILTGIRPVKIAAKLLGGGAADSEVIRHFTEECKTQPDRAELSLSLAKKEKRLTEDMYLGGVSLYIGIPFCPTRCLYCSFISNSVKSSGRYVEPYIECLKREIAYTAEIIRANKNRIETVYIGGGTPTTLSATQLSEIFKELFERFDLSEIKEFTVEAGRPDTITRDKLEVIKDFGIDRISINPQTMNLKTLEKIGRRHTPEDILSAYELARKTGIKIINMDIIAGLPGETVSDFEHTLRAVGALNPENITVHTMCIKRSSRLKETLSEYELTAGGEVAEMVELSKKYLSELGMEPYYLYRQKQMLGDLENIGYSYAGFESLYNIYIMEELQTIISMGCGGVTKTVDRKRDKIERIFNVKEPKEYIERIDEMLKRKDILRTGELY